jgi:hypothetical protein
VNVIKCPGLSTVLPSHPVGRLYLATHLLPGLPVPPLDVLQPGFFTEPVPDGVVPSYRGSNGLSNHWALVLRGQTSLSEHLIPDNFGETLVRVYLVE